MSESQSWRRAFTAGFMALALSGRRSPGDLRPGGAGGRVVPSLAEAGSPIGSWTASPARRTAEHCAARRARRSWAAMFDTCS